MRDTPIAERGQTGLGIGAASSGQPSDCRHRVSRLHTRSDGRDRATGIYDSLHFKWKIQGSNASARCRRWRAQHRSTSLTYFLVFLCAYSGLKVAIPSTPHDVKGLIKTALRDENPVIFIEHKDSTTPRVRSLKKSTSFRLEKRALRVPEGCHDSDPRDDGSTLT